MHSPRQSSGPPSRPSPSPSLLVLYKGQNTFGTTVSKTFFRLCVNKAETVNLGINCYQVVESGYERFAQYLVVYGRGGKTVGRWMR